MKNKKEKIVIEFKMIDSELFEDNFLYENILYLPKLPKGVVICPDILDNSDNQHSPPLSYPHPD